MIKKHKNRSKSLLSAFAFLMLGVSSANAITLTGSITNLTPLADDVGVYENETLAYGWCSPEDLTIVRPFTVGVSGTYGFSNLVVNDGAPSENLFLQINITAGPNYQPLINIDTYGMSPVAAAETGALVAGQQYYFVAVTACVDANGLPINFSVDLSGDGEIAIEDEPLTNDVSQVVEQLIQANTVQLARNTVRSNNKMIDDGLNRFITDRHSGQSLADAISTSGVSQVVVMPHLDANGETILGGGSFFGQSVSADGTYRKLTFGDFDIQHENGLGTTVSFNGRMAWERAVGDDAIVAYFIGAELNGSNIEGSYTGNQKRFGLSGGMYGYKALENNLYLSGYGALGIARSNLDITDGATSDVTGDYSSRTVSVGGKVSGVLEYETHELRPSVSLNYVKTWVGDINLDNSGASMDLAVGDTTFAELVAKPEFIIPMDQNEGSDLVTVASFAPHLICQLNGTDGTTTRACGAGLELGINGTSEDGATKLNAGIRFDRVGGVARQGLNLQAEFRF